MLPFLIIVLAFVADRVTKLWATENLVEFQPVKINEFLTLYPTYNRGVAFGMFQGNGPVIGWLSILIVIGLLVHMIRTPNRFWLLRLGLAMIIGGALGNLIDRITAGEVLDFIRVSFLPGIFNISDVMVNVGMLVSLGAVFLHPEQEEETAEEPLLIDQEPVMDAPELVESPFSDGENRRLEPDLDEQIEVGESYIPD
jgi:signal peptidase II